MVTHFGTPESSERDDDDAIIDSVESMEDQYGPMDEPEGSD